MASDRKWLQFGPLVRSPTDADADDNARHQITSSDRAPLPALVAPAAAVTGQHRQTNRQADRQIVEM